MVVVVFACLAGIVAWQQRELSELRDARPSAAAEARADALIGTPVGRWGYSVPARDAARLVATLCSLSATDARALDDLTASRDGEAYEMLTYLVNEFASTCQPRRHR